MPVRQRITPCLWFDSQGEEAAKFYTSIFKNSKIGKIARYDKAGEKVSGRPAGSVMTVEFQLEGQRFVALNGGPHFKFTEAISFVVNCETQAEIDGFWEKLLRGRKRITVRLAERQIRFVVADHPAGARYADGRQGSGAGRARGSGDAGDVEDRHRGIAGGVRRVVAARR